MKKAYIISTGTELLLGTTLDSNSVFLSQKMMELGIKVIGKSTVGDNHEQISRAFALGLESADIIISSGGLGPTFDDLTKIVTCELMDCKLELREEEDKRLREFFARRNRPMPEINLRQAMFPAEAIALKNGLGTAPGMYLKKDDKLFILLPGPPREMTGMYLNEVEPLLKKDFGGDMHKVIRKSIKVLGPGESQVEEMLGELMDTPKGCGMALLATDGEVHIRLTVEGSDEEESSRILNDLTAKIVGKMGRNVIAYDDETLVAKVANLLLAQGKRVAVAESCTGGMLGKLITDMPGSSNYFWGGVNSYSNEAKQVLLGVAGETLTSYGAVSEETAREMAQGIRKLSGTDFSLSITGNAGPGGGSPDKPVGLVYIGLAHASGCEVKELRFVGGRDAIRMISAKSALDLLRRHIEYKE
ncbi:MAG: competence/damage-inducible protein A [Firmicutes bacterium HGW-Firmicutes-15]|nr:MAG: competence/damage-inducible protein A [Firmicutes bacterium HGW-Firmicutes-15]